MLARTARHAAWLPAAVLLTYAVYAATGFGIVSDSRAAASSATTSVTASVLPELHIDLVNGSCGTLTDPDGAGPLEEDGAFTPTAMAVGAEDVTLASCAIDFGSNNNGATGASLWVESTRTSGANSFCNAAFGSPCAAPQFTDVLPGGVSETTWLAADDATPSSGAFGLRPTTMDACLGSDADWNTSTYYGLPQADAATGTQICDSSSTADESIVMSFRANPGLSQAATNYYVRTIFTVEAG